MQSLKENFPKARFNSEAFKRINDVLMQLNCNGTNTLFASSVCVDEINHLPTSLSYRLAEYWGECFYMGGLGGVPFVGKTGFAAYTHHVPKDGNIFILFSSHVGVSPDGEVGKVARAGQDHCGSACCAAIGGYNALKAAAQPGGQFDASKLPTDPHDVQFDYLKKALQPKYASISSHKNPQAKLSYELYDIIREYVMEICKGFNEG